MSSDGNDVGTPGFAHGRWRVTPSLGEVGHIAHDDVEVVRAVRVVARDQDWNTFPHRAGTPTVVDERTLRIPIEILEPDTADTDTADTDTETEVLARATVEVRLGDDCTVTADIHALREVDVNRLGVVVLLAPTLAGVPLVVVHPSDPPEATLFPERIAPHQPARDIRALRYVVGTSSVTVALDGDVFEMEDQRNWTDASFKVYSRPLALPFPYRVGPSRSIRQSVRVTAVPSRPVVGSASSDAPVGVGDGVGDGLEARDRSVGPAHVAPAGTLRVVPAGTLRVPEIGTSSGRHVDGPLPPPAPHAGPLIVELTADRGSWSAILDRAALEADALGVPVDLRVVAADADGLAAGLAAARDLHVARVGVFDPVTHVTEPAVWDALRRWRDARPTPLPLVAGTRAHFTELNRTIERLPRDADLVTFSMTPMMHATDPEHVEESLAMQSLVARDAVALAAGRPVVIGPVTFRRRFNAVATTPSPGSIVEARRGIDPVIGSEYAASWLARSVEAVSVPGVLAASWFEATGPRGLVSASGELTPAGALWLSLVA